MVWIRISSVNWSIKPINRLTGQLKRVYLMPNNTSAPFENYSITTLIKQGEARVYLQRERTHPMESFSFDPHVGSSFRGSSRKIYRLRSEQLLWHAHCLTSNLYSSPLSPHSFGSRWLNARFLQSPSLGTRIPSDPSRTFLGYLMKDNAFFPGITTVNTF